MARTKNYSDEEVLKQLEDMVRMMDQNGDKRSSLTYEGFSSFLAGREIILSANVLRHREKVAEQFRCAKGGFPTDQKKNSQEIPLEEKYEKLVALVKDLFVRSACNRLLTQYLPASLDLPEYVKPEACDGFIGRAGGNVTEKTEVMKALEDFYNKED